MLLLNRLLFVAFRTAAAKRSKNSII